MSTMHENFHNASCIRHLRIMTLSVRDKQPIKGIIVHGNTARVNLEKCLKEEEEEVS